MRNGCRYLVIGAGVHGLSTAWHLARRLRATGRGDGRDVAVLDKTNVAAGYLQISPEIMRDGVARVHDKQRAIGVGDLVARELPGGRQALPEPFRFSRFEGGRLRPVSASLFPWS